ncbi:MAG: putative Nucleoside diphosphate kinase [Candidatus Taylorbacteria bacterium]|nr:putative Nucleoside diphosphate kinase [Candidatus Taylorbacteria bacterium]
MIHTEKQHPKFERTLIIIKPDGIQRGLIGEITKRYERTGLKLIAMKMMLPTSDLVEKHYTIDPEWKRLVGEKTIKSAQAKGHAPIHEDPAIAGDMILDILKKYLTSGPVVAMVWQGMHAVEIVRKITGSTEPLSSGVGTIRGDFVIDSYKTSNDDGRAVRNLVHASSSVKDAEDEINHWFKQEEVFKYALVQEKILYDVNLDGIME